MPTSGRASRVGGEPGITKAVLTKIQVRPDFESGCVVPKWLLLLIQ